MGSICSFDDSTKDQPPIFEDSSHEHDQQQQKNNNLKRQLAEEVTSAGQGPPRQNNSHHQPQIRHKRDQNYYSYKSENILPSASAVATKINVDDEAQPSSLILMSPQNGDHQEEVVATVAPSNKKQATTSNIKNNTSKNEIVPPIVGSATSLSLSVENQYLGTTSLEAKEDIPPTPSSPTPSKPIANDNNNNHNNKNANVTPTAVSHQQQHKPTTTTANTTATTEKYRRQPYVFVHPGVGTNTTPSNAPVDCCGDKSCNSSASSNNLGMNNSMNNHNNLASKLPLFVTGGQNSMSHQQNSHQKHHYGLQKFTSFNNNSSNVNNNKNSKQPSANNTPGDWRKFITPNTRTLVKPPSTLFSSPNSNDNATTSNSCSVANTPNVFLGSSVSNHNYNNQNQNDNNNKAPKPAHLCPIHEHMFDHQKSVVVMKNVRSHHNNKKNEYQQQQKQNTDDDNFFFPPVTAKPNDNNDNSNPVEEATATNKVPPSTTITTTSHSSPTTSAAVKKYGGDDFLKLLLQNNSISGSINVADAGDDNNNNKNDSTTTFETCSNCSNSTCNHNICSKRKLSGNNNPFVNININNNNVNAQQNNNNNNNYPPRTETASMDTISNSSLSNPLNLLSPSSSSNNNNNDNNCGGANNRNINNSDNTSTSEPPPTLAKLHILCKTYEQKSLKYYVAASHNEAVDADEDVQRETAATTKMPEKFDFDFVIIGGGAAGLACGGTALFMNPHLASRFALCDFTRPGQTALGTKWSGLGGTCINAGSFPKKMFQHAGRVGETLKKRKEFGWDLEYHTSSSSENENVEEENGRSDNNSNNKKEEKEVFCDWNRCRQNINDHLRSVSYTYRSGLRTSKVKYINSLASFVDRWTFEVDSNNNSNNNTKQQFTARRIVIATGCRPHIPSEEECPGARKYGITSDDLYWLNRDPKKTLIIGGGPVALESACFLASMGRPVTIMMRSSSENILSKTDRGCAAKVLQMMKKKGVEFIDHSVVKKLEKKNEQNGNPLDAEMIQVTYRTNLFGLNLPTSIDDNVAEFDTVLFAIGRVAETESLNLEKIGVETDPVTKKVITNEWNRTSVSNIYCVGDAATFGNNENSSSSSSYIVDPPEVSTAAIKMGSFLARRLFKPPRTVKHQLNNSGDNKNDGNTNDDDDNNNSNHELNQLNHQQQQQLFFQKRLQTTNIPTAIFLSPFEFASVGLTEEEAKSKKVEFKVEVIEDFYSTSTSTYDENSHNNSNDEDSSCTATSNKNYLKLILEKNKSSSSSSEKILGVHILAPHASELIQGIAVGMKVGLTRNALEDVLFI